MLLESVDEANTSSEWEGLSVEFHEEYYSHLVFGSSELSIA